MSKDAPTMRRYQRIATPKGLWVAWEHNKHQSVSRVRDLNMGGLFVATPTPAAEGETVALLLSLPEGQIKCTAVVRNVTPSEGMGVEFRDLSAQDAERLERLVTRLLRSSAAQPD